MNQSGRSFLQLFTIFVISILAAGLFQVSDIVRALLTLPGIAAACGVAVQLYRDSKAHERSLEVQDRHQDFDLGVASHMANVAFDRHVQFCEAYLDRLMQGLAEISGSTPNARIAGLGTDLAEIRRKHLAWIASDTDLLLTDFEHHLKKTGLFAHALESIPVGDTRSKLGEEMMNGLIILMDISKPADDPSRGLASARIIGTLRKLLGIEELTTLRKAILNEALHRISSPPPS